MNAQRQERGLAAVRNHPDFGKVSFQTAATDTIADILHAWGMVAENIGGPSPAELLAAAQRTYEGDLTERDA